MSFSVLYVCTGNVCRSPLGELMFRAGLGTGPGVAVSSAGMNALVGQGIDHGSASALRDLGIDPSRHRARQFEGWMARDADLVLTAERAHRDAIMTAFPPAFRRTFTMKEFARAVRWADASDPREVVAQASAARHLGGEVTVADDDMPDPFGGSVDEAKEIAVHVSETVRATIAALGLAPRRRPAPRQPLAAAGRRPMPFKR